MAAAAALVPEFFEFGRVRLRQRQVGVVGLGAPQHHPLQLLLPPPLPLLPALLLLLGLLPLLQQLSARGDSHREAFGDFRDEGLQSDEGGGRELHVVLGTTGKGVPQDVKHRRRARAARRSLSPPGRGAGTSRPPRASCWRP